MFIMNTAKIKPTKGKKNNTKNIGVETYNTMFLE